MAPVKGQRWIARCSCGWVSEPMAYNVARSYGTDHRRLYRGHWGVHRIHLEPKHET
jgi:hypothetical protein